MSNNTQLQQLINDNIPTLEKYLNVRDITARVGIDHIFDSDEEEHILEQQLNCIKLLSRLKEGHIGAIEDIQDVYQELKKYIVDIICRHEDDLSEIEYERGELKEDKDLIEESIENLTQINQVFLFNNDLAQAKHYLRQALIVTEDKMDELNAKLNEESVEGAEDEIKIEFADFEAYAENLKILLEDALEYPVEETHKEITTTEKDITDTISKVIEYLLTSDVFKNLVSDVINKQ